MDQLLPLRPSSLPAFQPASLPVLRPSSLPAFQPCSPPAFQPSSPPDFQPSSLPAFQLSSLPAFAFQPQRVEGWKAGAGRPEGLKAGGWRDGRLEGWKAGRLEGWKAGRLEGWRTAGRLENGWRAGRLGGLEGRRGTERRFPDVLKLGGPMPLLLDPVQMICLSCLNVRVFKNRRRRSRSPVTTPHATCSAPQ